MSTYRVSFFKNLLSSDGHPFKCLQRRIDVGDVESAAQAAESALRAFEALYGCPWKLHADSIEVIAADPPIGAGQPSNIRAVWHLDELVAASARGVFPQTPFRPRNVVKPFGVCIRFRPRSVSTDAVQRGQPCHL
jgi:hypothetical protein